MCGILVLIRRRKFQTSRALGDSTGHDSLTIQVDARACVIAADTLKHRGPDAFNMHVGNMESSERGISNECFVMCHQRLSIVDVAGGSQPFICTNASGSGSGSDGGGGSNTTTANHIYTVANGEIYNHKVIREYIKYPYKTGSDCEVIIALSREYFAGRMTAPHAIDLLDGIFAFVTCYGDRFIAARDPIGVNPLFYGTSIDGSIVFASEAKVFTVLRGYTVKEFPAGHYMTENMDGPVQWYTTLNRSDIPKKVPDPFIIRHLLTTSVNKRLMADVPFGVLLSGGLDSSLIASIAARTMKKLGSVIHTFSIGMENAPDLIAARTVAAHIGSIHHEFVITRDDVIGCINDAVWHVETFDVATVRSAIPMILMSRKIKELGFKMVLDGDGSDEIFAGYEYNKYAPDATQLHKESLRKVKSLSRYDCKRANHATMAGGVECRCPFLDKALVDYVMNECDPKYKMFVVGASSSTQSITPPTTQPTTPPFHIEKYILRKAFADGGWLPESILMRSKVQFSAGCGNELINSLIAYGNQNVSDDEWQNAALTFPFKTPLSREAYYYRKIFESKFGPDFVDIVSYERSLNCSTAEAICWFPEEIRSCMDPCGIAFGKTQTNV